MTLNQQLVTFGITVIHLQTECKFGLNSLATDIKRKIQSVSQFLGWQNTKKKLFRISTARDTEIEYNRVINNTPRDRNTTMRFFFFISFIRNPSTFSLFLKFISLKAVQQRVEQKEKEHSEQK